jgi:hypothetical protein
MRISPIGFVAGRGFLDAPARWPRIFAAAEAMLAVTPRRDHPSLV